MSKFVDSWAPSITPSILSFPVLPLFHLHAVFLACFFIWNLCRPLRGTESVASILSRLDVMCGLSSGADAILLRSPAVWLHSAVWGGNEGLSEPLAIPFFSLSSPLAWDYCSGDERGARLSSCHCFEAASSLEQVSVGRAKDWGLGLKATVGVGGHLLCGASYWLLKSTWFVILQSLDLNSVM